MNLNEIKQAARFIANKTYSCPHETFDAECFNCNFRVAYTTLNQLATEQQVSEHNHKQQIDELLAQRIFYCDTLFKIKNEVKKLLPNEDVNFGSNAQPNDALLNAIKQVIETAIRYQKGELAPDEIMNLCHNLDKTVPVEEFAQGCVDHIKKLYGSCPLVKSGEQLPQYLQNDLQRSQARLQHIQTLLTILQWYGKYLTQAAMVVLRQSSNKWYDEPEEWQNQIIDLCQHLKMDELTAAQFLVAARQYVKDRRTQAQVP